MHPTATDHCDCTATLYLRSSPSAAAAERQQAAHERLAGLAADGLLAAVETERWAPTVPVGDGEAPDREFLAWADRAGVSLEPCFDTREEYSLVSEADERRTVRVRPVLCLALRDDDGLTGVYPHATDGDVVTVPDALDALAAPEPSTDGRAARPVP